jgi:hypothetical protein
VQKQLNEIFQIIAGKTAWLQKERFFFLLKKQISKKKVTMMVYKIWDKVRKIENGSKRY